MEADDLKKIEEMFKRHGVAGFPDSGNIINVFSYCRPFFTDLMGLRRLALKQTLTAYAAVVQLLTILLLQFYSIASHPGHKPARPQCVENHAQCGCPQDKVASHTCCCFHTKPHCCAKDERGDDDSVAQKPEKPSSRYFSAAPCGGAPKFIAASLEEIKFLRPGALLQVPSTFTLTRSPAGSEMAPSRFTEPSVPPPKFAPLA